MRATTMLAMNVALVAAWQPSHGVYGARPLRSTARPSMISDEMGRKLAQKGFAIPGMEDVGREVKGDMAARLCTAQAPCDFDAPGAIVSLLQTVGGAVIFVLFIAQVAGSTIDEEALEEQAARSRARREKTLQDFAERLRPLQESPLGWTLVDDKGLPTGDAFVFLAIAIAAQLWLAWLVTETVLS